MARRQPVLADQAVHNLVQGGMGKVRANVVAAQALTHVWQLAYAAHKLDHWPTQAEYAAYWEVNERTAQRHWETFRRAFPGQDSPDELAQWVLAQASSRIDDPACAMTAPLKPALATA
jgi:hypothetical protein